MRFNVGVERRYISGGDGDNRVYISVDDGINVARSQDTSHSSSHNCGGAFDRDCRGG